MYIYLGFLIFYGRFRVASSLCFKARLSAKLLACTQTLFYFSFRSFRKHRRAKRVCKNECGAQERKINIGELASKVSVQEQAWSTRKKNKFFFFPHPYPPALAVNKFPPAYTLSPPLAGLFEEKIEGLWTGYQAIDMKMIFLFSC